MVIGHNGIELGGMIAIVYCALSEQRVPGIGKAIVGHTYLLHALSAGQ